MLFTKMHGLGNDYVYVNCFEKISIDNPSALAIEVSDRHKGIGADGLILISPSDIADARMRIFNADGSEAEMCGNGLRCVAKFIYDRNLAQPSTSFSVPGQQSFRYSLNIETGNGVLTVGIEADENDKATEICVNMGQPILTPAEIPVDIDAEEIINYPIEIEGEKLEITCISMGNPHAIFFCENVTSIPLEQIGPIIENHSLFPNRINVHFVNILSENEFNMRTWERGSGVTMACGTGACACGVAAILTGQTERITTAHLPGGDLKLNYSQQDNCVYMTGPATEVFEGNWIG